MFGIRMVGGIAVCAALALGCSKLSGASAGEQGSSAQSSAALTDEMVVKYIKAYKALKALGPGIASKYKEGEDPKAQDPKGDFAAIEGAIKGAGFSSYAEFVQVNAKIAWAFNTAQGQAFLNDMDSHISDAEKQMQAAIDDPNTPAEVKKQLTEQRDKLRAEYAKNKKWADFSMKTAGRFTDQQSAEVVMRHRKELEEVFRGI